MEGAETMTMAVNRPAFLLASLAATMPAVVVAETMPAAGNGHPLGGTPNWAHGTSIAIILAAILLLGGAALMLSARINWRLGAIAIVGGCALLGGDLVIDGAWTAIAVTP